MKKIYICLCLLALVLSSIKCDYKNKDCSSKSFRFSDKEYSSKGCMLNGLEEGEWLFFDSNKELSEKGTYENGIRVGKWLYPLNKSDSTIMWRRYEKGDLQLVFNIPTLLEIVEDSAEYIKFSNNDTSKLFNVVLSIYPIEQSGKTIEQYYKQGEEEIVAKGWSFTSHKEKIITPNRELYFNEYSITQNSLQRFTVLNAYALLSNNSIFEINCRFDEEIDASARLIFFSILSNSFYNKQRLLNPFEKIKSG